MKKLLSILVLLPAIAFSQKNNAYIKLTGATGLPIKGNSVARGFERQIEAYPFQSNSANNDTRISFTMPVGPASGELRANINSKQLLPKGEVTITSRGSDRLVIVYKINMENIKVESCDDVQDLSGQVVTQVVLRAVRIGWTYYTSSKSGALTVSGKSGWDSERSVAWTSF